jgi:beta-ureidopropionase / N-carbamoyl-L-amino-acid hydrolase
MSTIRINSQRLWGSLMEMAKIGATEKGGCRRLALTDLDKQGRNLFVSWCEEVGCTITVDQFGNIFARKAGLDNSLPPIMTGSHLDTQPTGGKFDGVYGVLSGLEVLRTLHENNVLTKAPLEVAVWTNEEGSRFAPAMLGSGVFIGKFSLEQELAKEDVDGIKLGDELKRIGYAGDTPIGGRPIGAYFEAHIEQGPILENEQKTIGVVNKGQGQRWYDVTITGQESHAGTTPMNLRKDALVAAAKLIQEVQKIANDHGPNACGTVGFTQVYPNSRNTIPGSVTMSVDLRHPEDDVLTQLDVALNSACEKIIREEGVELNLDPYWYYPPIPFDEQCVSAVREGAERCGYSHMDIYSGAGHDACYLAEIAPAGMIFIPCENGISHNEIENVTQDDCEAGCNVLLHAVLQRAGIAQND